MQRQSTLLKPLLCKEKNIITHLECYTDAAVRDGQAGVAAYMQIRGATFDLLHTLHLEPFGCSASAEFVAAILAMESAAAIRRQTKNVITTTIASDFIAVCGCINARSSHNFPPAIHLDRLVQNLAKTHPISSRHTPTRSKIAGNVLADRAAYAAARGESAVVLLVGNQRKLTRPS